MLSETCLKGNLNKFKIIKNTQTCRKLKVYSTKTALTRTSGLGYLLAGQWIESAPFLIEACVPTDELLQVLEGLHAVIDVIRGCTRRLCADVRIPQVYYNMYTI